jgi:expansin (peptidoglycan-binding protein)
MVVATIVDECPYGKDGNNTVCANNPNGHLDLSTAVFDQLGYSVGNPSGTNWKFVPCPVTGNIVLQVKNGNNNEFFIQNSILAVKTVARGGETAILQAYGAWHFNGALNSGDTLTLTDAANRTLMIQVPGTAMGQSQDTGKQFPACQ